MSDDRMAWREVTASEAIAFCLGKTVASADDAFQRPDVWYDEMTTWFTDGTALRVRAGGGTVYSEWTQDPVRLDIEIGVPAAPSSGGR